MANKVSVINPSYCVPQSITLQINTEKRVAYSETDDRLFYIEDTFFTLHDRRVLYDNTKNPIVTFYDKSSEECKVFKGKSSDSSKFLFGVNKMKKSSTIPSGITKLNVFLAKNRDKEKSDFRVIIYGKVNGRAVFISGNLLPTSKSVFPIPHPTSERETPSFSLVSFSSPPCFSYVHHETSTASNATQPHSDTLTESHDTTRTTQSRHTATDNDNSEEWRPP
ncbi:hypothetical protein DEO72_LG10g3272 [Vigna unguiculata]|uniref:Uncharacterized protein n=1 Tax=Vigna unguiculata TaxID=3917 RepID=A0A4D6NDU5_VIGUN|nr:hypothetical protein DEO72_LG10g3272 [Vigna unguiculata]